MRPDDRSPAEPVPMPLTGWFVASDGARLPYRMKGAGPPLVLLHGWSQSGAMFQHQLDGLSDRRTVIVPDLRGHGEAPAPAGGLRMARLAQDLRELLRHLAIDRADMLGWSMGASVLWASIDLFGTAAIDRLVLVDQPPVLTVLPGMDTAAADAAGALFSIGQVYGLYEALLGPEGPGTRAGFVGGMVTRTISPSLYAWILAENAKTDCAVAAEMLVSHCLHDWRDVLPRIDRPTLVIGGSISHVPTRSQRFVHGRIAGSTYHEFDERTGGAHFPFLEAPADFNRVVGAFLDAERGRVTSRGAA